MFNLHYFKEIFNFFSYSYDIIKENLWERTGVMKKYRLLFAAVCAAALLVGCGKKEMPTVTASPETTQPSETTKPPLTAEELAEKRRRELRQTVEDFAYELMLPDGRQARLDSGFGAMEGNHFAYQDVDGDGEKELVLSFSTCSMAEMTLYVCGYDGESVTQELVEFPSVTFYPGGMAVAEMSHNQGLAGDDMWPYHVYTYDKETGTYSQSVTVDGWDRTLAETNYNGEPFPEHIDLDGDGYVYLVSRDGVTRCLDGPDYEAWRKNQGLAAEPLEVTYYSVSRDNIRAVFSAS